MTTNSKHYEILAIEPWEIMERNFTNEEFVAYLKGNIIKYTLRDKGQALTDAEKIKHYAEKLIEVLEEKDMDEFLDDDAERIYGDYEYRQEEPEGEHKFKVGDHVRLLKGDNETGTIIRTPVEGLMLVDRNCYIIEFDEPYNGWKATKAKYSVDSERAWYVEETEIELLPKKTLEPYKWYDAEDYTVEELRALLPVGTTVLVTKWHDSNRTVDLEEEETKLTETTNIGQRWEMKDTRVGVEADIYWRRYFKIV